MNPKLINAIAILLPIAFILTSQLKKENGEFSPPTIPKISEQWNIERIIDGDTIIAKQNQQTRKVRLCGIDSPEKNQPISQEAKQFIEQLVNKHGKTVAITFIERDRYNRWIGEIFLKPEHNEQIFLNEELVLQGYAWPYKQYWHHCPNQQAIAAAEELANQNNQGIWLKKENIEPWKWRRTRNNHTTDSLRD